MKAIILSAGEGTRMRPLTLTKPKTMLPVAGKPIIQYNIEALRDCGVKDILLIVGYKEEIVKNYFKDGSQLGVNISYATQSKLEGTADAIGYGKDFIEDSLITLNGDIILDVDILSEIIDDYEKSKPDTLMVLTEVEDPSAFGVVELDGDNIINIVEKPKKGEAPSNLINTGIYIFNKDIFDKAGVAYPTNDMTWEEYDKLARSVTDTTPGAEVYGSHYHTWRSTIQLDGILDGKHTIVDGEYDFTKPYYEMVLNQQKDGVCMDYATLKTQGLHYSAAFAQGNVATMNMGSWFIATLIQKIKDGEYTDCTNWGIVKYPHADGVEAGSTLSTITALAVPTSAPNKDAAWDFVKFVSGAEGAEVMASTGNIPAMTNKTIVDIIASMDGFPTDDASKEALNVSNLYLEVPYGENVSEINSILDSYHGSIMTGEMSIDDGIAAMNKEISALK